MMLERFNDDAKHAVVLGQEAARALGHDHLGTEHLLLGLVRLDGSAVREALAAVGVTDTSLTAQIEDVMGTAAATKGGSLPFDEQTRAALTAATTEADELGMEAVGPEHVLLGLLDAPDGNAMLMIEKLGTNAGAVRTAMMAQLEPTAAAPAKASAGKEIGSILVDKGVLTQTQLDEALEGARDKLIGRALIDLGLIKERDLVAALASQIGLDFVDLETYPIEPWAAQLIPPAAAWRHHVIAIGEDNGRLLVAMSDPGDAHAIDDIRVITNRQIQPVVAMALDIERAIREKIGTREEIEDQEIPVTSRSWYGDDPNALSPAEPWRGPEDNVLGVGVPLNPVLAVTDTGVFVAVSDLIAYPNGFRMTVTLRRKAALRSDKWFEAVSWQHRWQGSGIPELSPRALRLGIEFPGGDRVDNLSFRDMPSRKPPGPSMISLGAQGSSWRVDVEYWVWPLPTEGEASFFIEWPSEGVPLTRVAFDTKILADAAKQVHVLWDEEPG